MDLHRLTVSQARKGLREKTFSCLEYVQSLLERSARHLQVNAWAYKNDEQLERQARQLDKQGLLDNPALPLAGIPIAVKDNIDVEDMPGTAGTGALQGRIPAHSAGVVQGLMQAGGLIAGKTGMHELAMGITSNNALTGAIRNPYDLRRFPGGSSGGSAAAVAAGFVPCALGTETGGSIRLPAALCGLTGLRPSLGRYSDTGLIPLSRTRDAAGPLARSVDDLLLIDSLLAGDDKLFSVELSEVRLGVPRDSLLADLEPGVAAVFDSVLSALAKQGVQLVDADIPLFLELDAEIGFPLVLYELQRDLPAYIEDTWKPTSFEEIFAGIASNDVAATVANVLGDGRIRLEDYLRALQQRTQLQTLCADYFRQHRLDAMIFPTTPLPAALIEESHTVKHNGREQATFPLFSRNCNPGSVAGLPGINLPAGMSKGLPVGVSLGGPWHSDRWLLHLAQSIEALLPPMPEPQFVGG